MARLPFVEKEPQRLWQDCVQNEVKWKNLKQYPHASTEETIKKFRLQQAVDLIWTSNVLEDTIQKTVAQDEVHSSLKKLIGPNVERVSADCIPTELWPYVQHWNAYTSLSGSIESGNSPLTEQTICETHEIMMKGHRSEDGSGLVRAGSYRQITVHAGHHCYPDHRDIPHSMSRIIEDYNERSKREHDSYELAAWLYYNVISLHPFEDGNGRLCRLLWSYSLMKDGVPFPLVMSSGHRKAQKHCVWCIVKGRKLASGSHPHLTTLTVWSAHQAWQKFFEFLGGQ